MAVPAVARAIAICYIIAFFIIAMGAFIYMD